MVDLETLSTASNAIILTIGCIPFGSDGSYIVSEDMYFYNRVDLTSYNEIMDKFHMDFNTLLWWIDQDRDPFNEAFTIGPRKAIEQVITDFALWIIQICRNCHDNKITMWSHGKDFDCVVLQNAFKIFGIPCPWNYWDTRDTRTIYALAGVNTRNIKMSEGFKAHNAIADCMKQIESIRQSFLIINNVKNCKNDKNDKNDNEKNKCDNKNDERRLSNRIKNKKRKSK